MSGRDAEIQHAAAGEAVSSRLRRIRIAHVLFRLDYGGLENGVVNIIRSLPADFEHTIISLTDSTDFRRRLPENVPVHEVRKPPGNSPMYLQRVRKLLSSGRFDIVHTRNLPCLEAQVAGLLAGVPARIHGEHGWDIFDLTGSKLRYRWLRRMSRLVVQRYVVVSRHLESYLLNEIGIPAGRISRICNGVDVAAFHPGAAAPDTFVVGAVGRLEPVKDFMSLAHAFAALARRPHDSSRLVLVGAGSQQTAIARFLADSGLGARSELAGACDDVAERLRAFSVFVLPSRAEGMSNTVLEAMASGLPVIATDVGGNGELVRHGETGFLVKPGDPGAIAERLAFYHDHPAIRAQHGRAARERAVREFSLETMMAGYARLYRECATRRHGAGAAA